jgi:DNA-binding HxlR family transcriptional regulator
LDSNYKYHSNLYVASILRTLNLGRIIARSYDLRCPVAHALDVVGERWAILILRDLFRHKTRKFQDFERELPGLTPSVLSARLKDMEAKGIIASRLYAEHPPRPEYFLTPKGVELGPVLLALKKWGEKYSR